MENLMNLVMQFRKVCNHPDLFERRVGRQPYIFRELQVGVQANIAYQTSPDVRSQALNPITQCVPKLIFDECWLISDNNRHTFTQVRKHVDISMSSIAIDTHYSLFNIFNAKNLHDEFFTSGSTFGILRLMAKGNGWSVNDFAYLFVADKMMQIICLIHFHA